MPTPVKFQKTMYVTAFQLARDGHLDSHIAAGLGVTLPTLLRWMKQDPAMLDAVTRGRRGRPTDDSFTFSDYVYDRLPPELQKVWDELRECETAKSGVDRIRALLGNAGIRARQHLFLHALTQSQFNVSQALHRLMIPRKSYNSWVSNDPDFAALVDELMWHKQNFFESAFIKGVHEGNPALVLHGVKTQCADRGYNDRLQIEHKGTVSHNHTHTVDVVDLDLPLDVRKAILAALRKHQAQSALKDASATPKALETQMTGELSA